MVGGSRPSQWTCTPPATAASGRARSSRRRAAVSCQPLASSDGGDIGVDPNGSRRAPSARLAAPNVGGVDDVDGGSGRWRLSAGVAAYGLVLGGKRGKRASRDY